MVSLDGIVLTSVTYIKNDVLNNTGLILLNNYKINIR